MVSPIKEIKQEVKPCPLDIKEIQGFVPTGESYLNTTRIDKFILVMDLPKCLKSSDTCTKLNLEKLQLAVHGKALPAISIPSMEVPTLGHTFKFSSKERKAYQPITVKFQVDSNFHNYYVLFEWLNMINSIKTGVSDPIGSGDLSSYSAIFSLYMLQEYNKPVARWDYYPSFVTDLGSINLDKRNSEIVECDFTFDYSFINMELLHY